MRGSFMLQKEVAEGEYIILNFIIGYFSCFTLLGNEIIIIIYICGTVVRDDCKARIRSC